MRITKYFLSMIGKRIVIEEGGYTYIFEPLYVETLGAVSDKHEYVTFEVEVVKKRKFRKNIQICKYIQVEVELNSNVKSEILTDATIKVAEVIQKEYERREK